MAGKPGKRAGVSLYSYGPLPGVNLRRSTAQAIFANFPFLPAIVWSGWLEIGRASTAFGSTDSIGFVFHGRQDMPTPSRLPTTTEPIGKARPASGPAARRLPACRPPTHPGEMLREEFLKPLGISQSAFARRLGISYPRLNEIVRGKRSVTPDTALRLAQVTGMGADFWLGLQQDWDLWHALTAERAAAIALLEPLPRPG